MYSVWMNKDYAYKCAFTAMFNWSPRLSGILVNFLMFKIVWQFAYVFKNVFSYFWGVKLATF